MHILSNKNEELSGIRLDKWLWAARLYKSRSIARSMIEGGKVHYNGSRVKPGRIVEIGASIKLWQGYSQKEIIVQKLTDIRRQPELAQTMYKETDTSIARREKESAAHKMATLFAPHPDEKPDKKQRRTLINFKHSIQNMSFKETSVYNEKNDD